MTSQSPASPSSHKEQSVLSASAGRVLGSFDCSKNNRYRNIRRWQALSVLSILRASSHQLFPITPVCRCHYYPHLHHAAGEGCGTERVGKLPSCTANKRQSEVCLPPECVLVISHCLMVSFLRSGALPTLWSVPRVCWFHCLGWSSHFLST